MAGTVLVRNTCSRAKVEACYEPLIDDAIQTYRTLFGDQLVDVRLMGSVACGEAIAGQSDVDFLAFLRNVPEPATLERPAACEDTLRDAYPVVGHVDLEAEHLDGLSAPRVEQVGRPRVGSRTPETPRRC
jgi:hypothetical protein